MKETDFLMVSLSPPEAGCIIEETLKCQMVVELGVEGWRGGGCGGCRGGREGGREGRAVSCSGAAAVMKHWAASRQLPDSSFLKSIFAQESQDK